MAASKKKRAKAGNVNMKKEKKMSSEKQLPEMRPVLKRLDLVKMVNLRESKVMIEPLDLMACMKDCSITLTKLDFPINFIQILPWQQCRDSSVMLVPLDLLKLMERYDSRVVIEPLRLEICLKDLSIPLILNSLNTIITKYDQNDAPDKKENITKFFKRKIKEEKKFVFKKKAQFICSICKYCSLSRHQMVRHSAKLHKNMKPLYSAIAL